MEGVAPNSRKQKKKGKEEGGRKSARWRSHRGFGVGIAPPLRFPSYKSLELGVLC